MLVLRLVRAQLVRTFPVRLYDTDLDGELRHIRYLTEEDDEGHAYIGEEADWHEAYVMNEAGQTIDRIRQ